MAGRNWPGWWTKWQDRNSVSAIAVAIYTATLSNHLIQDIPKHVYPVARSMGLPESSLPVLRSAPQGAVPDISP